MTSTFTATLPSGELQIRVKRAAFPLDSLCGFASRKSNRRGFVFVSKVLGKHWPVRPSRFDACCLEIARKIKVEQKPVLVVGMAETATGLGHGVYESLQRIHDSLNERTSLFVHGTRYRVEGVPALTFEETHSHATTHWLHMPESQKDREVLSQAKSLVIVDDEQTTGRTALALTRSIGKWCPNLSSVTIACLTDFISDADREHFVEAAGMECNFVSLLNGSYSFHPDTSYQHIDIRQTVRGSNHTKVPWNFGRLGISGTRNYEDEIIGPKSISTSEKILVLGTGEFQYPAICYARALEKQGHDVHFQSTTRSPLLVSGDLKSMLEFADPYGEEIQNYLYNVTPDSYDRFIILHELPELPKHFNLPQQLRAEVICVPPLSDAS